MGVFGGLQMLELFIVLGFLLSFGKADCDVSMCHTACSAVGLIGTCDSGLCECAFPTKCKDMESSCDLACQVFKMDGECNAQDNCNCKITPDICPPWNCEESCLDDPRAKSCILVVPAWCMDYGPFEFCGCVCYQAAGGRTRKRCSSKLNKVKIAYRFNVTQNLNPNDIYQM